MRLLLALGVAIALILAAGLLVAFLYRRRPRPAPEPDARHRMRNLDETRPIAHPKGSVASRRERAAHAVRAFFYRNREGS